MTSVTCKCSRCGATWTLMAGSPYHIELDWRGYREVCEACAQKDGGFCPACLYKPCLEESACEELRR